MQLLRLIYMTMHTSSPWFNFLFFNLTKFSCGSNIQYKIYNLKLNAFTVSLKHTCRHLLLVSCWSCFPAEPLGHNMYDLHPHNWSHYWRPQSPPFCRLWAHNLKPNTENWAQSGIMLFLISPWRLRCCWSKMWLRIAMISIKGFLFNLCYWNCVCPMTYHMSLRIVTWDFTHPAIINNAVSGVKPPVKHLVLVEVRYPAGDVSGKGQSTWGKKQSMMLLFMCCIHCIMVYSEKLYLSLFYHW